MMELGERKTSHWHRVDVWTTAVGKFWGVQRLRVGAFEFD
jgi:hypothetical protein